jgi:prolactin regulatory element-binding protein
VVYKNELKLSNEEDAPMTMAVDRKVRQVQMAKYRADVQGKKLITGVNSSQQSVESGSNDHARVYSFADDK